MAPIQNSKSIQFNPFILSGGSGTRLWPVSRSQFPKQFCDLFDESLFGLTLRRLASFGNPGVVTHQSMKVLTENVLKTQGLETNHALYEPRANNTAPAIALICKTLSFSKTPLNQLVVGVFPADHLIQEDSKFRSAIEAAAKEAEKGVVATIGIRPSFPSTGYGYIEVQGDVDEATNRRAIKTLGFREKPSLPQATEFLTSGRFLWNAGMFFFRVDRMIENFKKHMPELWAQISALSPDGSNLGSIYEAIARDPKAATSIDYGIMEKIQDQVCVPGDFGWNDVGSWDEIAKLTETAKQISIHSKDNFTFLSGTSQRKVVGLIGVQDLVIVDTPDALLISKKGMTQEVKQIPEQLKIQKDSRAEMHPFEIRPWGKFEILRDTPDYKSKVIHVSPSQQISYQSHQKRSEHWVIIRGEAEVTLDGIIRTIKPGESIFVPSGTKHRIRNPHPSAVLEFIEVQVGSYFGEDDIIRYQDDYKRS